MERKLSREEADFVAKFHSKEEIEEIGEEIHFEEDKRWSSKIFWAAMGVFFLCPFVLTAILFSSLARYEGLTGPGFFTLMEGMTDEERDAMGRATGITDLSLISEVYESRFLITAGLFSVFFLLIALCVGLRGLIQYYSRSKSE